MFSKAFLVIGILGIIWLATGLVIAARSRTLNVNLPRLVLCVAIVLLVFFASIAANLNGW